MKKVDYIIVGDGYAAYFFAHQLIKNNKSFVQLISVKTASPAGFKTVNPGPIDVTEYILFYVKNRKEFEK